MMNYPGDHPDRLRRTNFPFYVAGPEDGNEEDLMEVENDEDHEKDPVPVSGWSMVEVSTEPGAGVPPSARSLHAATLLVGSTRS